MAQTVITVDDDMVDLVVWRATGRIAGALEATLDVNPHLAKAPPVLPAGIAILIPDVAIAQPPRPQFKLWE